jgi:2'-hydroxyisoflavone reductase
MVDVRDLAEWIVLLIENGTMGVFNASGPAPGELTMGETLEGCRRASNSDARFTWVPAEFLEKQNVSAWMDMPLWVPPTGDSAGFHLRSTTKAVAAGLKFRPVDDTARAILEWWPRELERRVRVTEQMKQESRDAGKPEPQMPDPHALRAGIRPEREVEVLAAWHAQESGNPTRPQ